MRIVLLKLKIFIRKNDFLERVVKYFYAFFFNRSVLQKKLKRNFLKGNKKTLYIIRPVSEDGVQGLMSLFIQVLRKIDYANRKGFIPYIDFENYKTQYHKENFNAWEFFFTQPKIFLENKNTEFDEIILSGYTLRKTEDNRLFKETIFNNEEICIKCSKLYYDNFDISPKVDKLLSSQREYLNINECTGIYLRGTDYVKLKPSGENVQPDINLVLKEMKKFKKKFPNSKFFLVTEDYEIFRKINKHFPNNLRVVNYDKFIKNYEGIDYLSKTNLLDPNIENRGIEYLVKILLLSECKNLISSVTMGSISAYALNGKQYSFEHIFQLGKYK